MGIIIALSFLSPQLYFPSSWNNVPIFLWGVSAFGTRGVDPFPRTRVKHWTQALPPPGGIESFKVIQLGQWELALGFSCLCFFPPKLLAHEHAILVLLRFRGIAGITNSHAYRARKLVWIRVFELRNCWHYWLWWAMLCILGWLVASLVSTH